MTIFNKMASLISRDQNIRFHWLLIWRSERNRIEEEQRTIAWNGKETEILCCGQLWQS